MSDKKYVWYLSYGSNLSKDRFLCYIQGGTPFGSLKCETGCRDKNLPLKDEPYEISYPLYFSKKSARWNGGVAFISKHEEANTKTLARMYLISEEQFMDVISQENNGVPVSFILDEVKKEKSKQISNNWYGNILYIGEKDSYPIFSFTSNEDIDDVLFTKPSKAYLNTIALGIKETFQMEHREIIQYLYASKGMK